MRHCFKYSQNIRKSACNQRIICAVETRGRSFRFPLRAVLMHRPRFPSFRCIFAGENAAAAEILLPFYKPLAFSGTMW